MILRPMSDLHLEWGEYSLPEAPNEAESVLILAGDILVADCGGELRTRFVTFLKDCTRRFKSVIYIAGNHEHYGTSIFRVAAKLQVIFDLVEATNFHYLQNSSVTLEDEKGLVTFVGATLWTDCGNNPFAPMLWQGMNDSKAIRCGPNSTLPYERKFSSHDANRQYIESKRFMLEEAERCKALGHRVVCLSHHAPSYKSVAPMYYNDEMNIFYASNMDLDVMDANPELWIHGHMHSNADYYVDETQQISQTRIVLNPRGYVTKHSAENEEFNPLLTIEI